MSVRMFVRCVAVLAVCLTAQVGRSQCLSECSPRFVIVLTGISIENASMLTQIMIDHFKVHHLLLSGIAGGVDPGHNIGDVVIAEKWAFPLEGYWSHDSAAPSPCGKPGDRSEERR